MRQKLAAKVSEEYREEEYRARQAGFSGRVSAFLTPPAEPHLHRLRLQRFPHFL